MGYARAGFEVVGVDIAPQPSYCGDEFVQRDALTVLDHLVRCGSGCELFPLDGVVAVHASPPCQAWTAYNRTGNVGEYPEFIDPVRDELEARTARLAVPAQAQRP
jgi:DNA (cytosine-5)-methyltransferase 1